MHDMHDYFADVSRCSDLPSMTTIVTFGSEIQAFAVQPFSPPYFQTRTPSSPH
jgi:hypothetical protein